MRSIRDLYKVGKGPSSSHTMGPERAARIFLQENPGAERFEVVLYGSLSKTGVGHGTDRVLRDVLGAARTSVVFSETDPPDLPADAFFELLHNFLLQITCKITKRQQGIVHLLPNLTWTIHKAGSHFQ